jgi:epoxyqueuosine reductase
VNCIQELVGSTVRFLGLLDGRDFGQAGSQAAHLAADRFEAWLADGCQAGMGWLSGHRESRHDPGKVLEGTASVLVFAMPWETTGADAGPGSNRGEPAGTIAGYALGRDYHVRFRKELATLLAALGRTFPEAAHRLLVDANPLAERFFAALTGTGHIGRNTMFIHRELGARVFLATLLSTATPSDLARSFGIDAAGQASVAPPACPPACRRCIAACPTGALTAAVPTGRLDARLCLSYHSIESDAGIPEPLRPAMGLRLFGCSACVDACPLAGTPAERRMALSVALSLGSHDDFCREFAGNAVMRAGWRQFQRCACIAAGNSGASGLTHGLGGLQSSPDALTADHAAWALRRIKG